MNDLAMPWYVALLGQPADGELFLRLVTELELAPDKGPQATPWWYENKQGVSVAVQDGKVDAIQFFSAENPHFSGYPGPLPFGLSFAMMRDEIHACLGQPDDVLTPSSEATTSDGGIERYHTEACTVMVAYSATSGRLEVIGFEV